MIEHDLLQQAQQFPQRENDVQALVARAEAVHAVDSAPLQERVELDGEEVGEEQGEVEGLAGREGYG